MSKKKVTSKLTLEQERKLLLKPCKTRDELKAWIKYFLNLELPDVTVSRYSDTNPLDVIFEVYDICVNSNNPHKIKELLFVAGRGSGKTLGMAIAELMVLLHDKREVVHVGAILNQAERCYAYQKNFLYNRKLKPLVIPSDIPEGMRILEKANMSKSIFNVGGEKLTLEVIPCTLKACLVADTTANSNTHIYSIKVDNRYIKVASTSSILTTDGLIPIKDLSISHEIDEIYKPLLRKPTCEKRGKKHTITRSVDICREPGCGASLYRNKKDFCKEHQRCTQCDKVNYKHDLCRIHYEEYLSSKSSKCKHCDNPSIYPKALSLCSSHYHEWEKENKAKCKIDGCDRHIDKKNMCGAHYQVYRRANQLKKCTKCENKVHSNKLCYKHYFESLPPLEQFSKRVRTRITNAFGENQLSKSKKTENLLGVSIKDAMTHIESKFQPGMSWGNHTYDGWHIDHICPVSQAKNQEELEKLQHYSNLTPAWGENNIKKSNMSTQEAQYMCRKLLGREWQE